MATDLDRIKAILRDHCFHEHSCAQAEAYRGVQFHPRLAPLPECDCLLAEYRIDGALRRGDPG